MKEAYEVVKGIDVLDVSVGELLMEITFLPFDNVAWKRELRSGGHQEHL